MKDFVAIDFETANFKRSSICSAGLVIVRDGIIQDKIYSLIHPIPNYYSPGNTAIHGLSKIDTDPAPYFYEFWDYVKEQVEGLPFVAHNSPFDESCLRAIHQYFNLEYPESYKFYCTCKTSRRIFGKELPNHQLHTVSYRCGFDLSHHHHAMADAEACCAITLFLDQNGIDLL
ncbi:3'-5' exonuclease [Porphyromonas pogonae]|uniref:3'-5' exonuclease n=1 Tax=Porphyromonas pogonae TaxID=867595 RepID=UPI002E79DB55|nr:3'-5' exonuclease [Porphyromonas pogonae]